MTFEYKIIPAPTKGLKAKGKKTGADRFANALEVAINSLATDGWEYLRTDTLPSAEREGLIGKTTVFRNVLVFKRQRNDLAPSPLLIDSDDGADSEVDQEAPITEAAAEETSDDFNEESPELTEAEFSSERHDSTP